MPKRMLLSNRTSGDLIGLSAMCSMMGEEFNGSEFLPCITFEDEKYKAVFVVIEFQDNKIVEILKGGTIQEMTLKLQKYSKKLRENKNDVRENKE